MTRRLDRVNVLLRQEISKVISSELNDPRLASVVSITQVETSPDLRNAKVHVSVLGDEAQKQRTLDALKSASGFIHRTIKPNLSFKSVPFLFFQLDNSIEKGAELLERIKELGLPELSEEGGEGSESVNEKALD